MGSVRFDGEDESQPRTTRGKKYKLPKKHLNDSDSVNHASVPKKLRSEIKKRGHESTIPPLPISRKQRCVSNRVETLRKHGAKKSSLNMKQRHITKDEEEVAETLYALANMFSDIAKTNKPVLDGEPSITKSSNVVESTVAQEQVSDSGVQYDEHHHLNVDKCKGVLQAPSLCSTGTLHSETQGSSLKSSLNRFPDWFENTNCANENIVTADKIHYRRVVLESKNSRKRCSTHVYIARLIKMMEESERKIRLMQRPTQLTTTGGIVQGHHHVSSDHQKRGIGGGYGVLSFNGFTHSSSEPFSWSKNGYSSTLDGSTSAAAAAQKWNAELQSQYNPGGRDSASLGNYAQALFPHLHSALGSKYQPFSHPRQQFTPVFESGET